MLPVHLVWKTLKNSLLTLLYNKLIGPDLSLFNYVRLPEFAPLGLDPCNDHRCLGDTTTVWAPHSHSGLPGVRVRRVGEKTKSAGGPLTWSQNGTWIRPYVTWFLPVSICQNTSSLRDRLLSTIRKSHPLRSSYFSHIGDVYGAAVLPVHLVWKTLKNSLLTLLYNKLIGPDLSLFKDVRLPEFAPISRSPGQPPP